MPSKKKRKKDDSGIDDKTTKYFPGNLILLHDAPYLLLHYTGKYEPEMSEAQLLAHGRNIAKKSKLGEHPLISVTQNFRHLPSIIGSKTVKNKNAVNEIELYKNKKANMDKVTIETTSNNEQESQDGEYVEEERTETQIKQEKL